MIGVLLQEYFVTRHAVEVIIDLFYFSIITVIVFGFVSVFLTGQTNAIAAKYLILGMLLWEIVRVTQYTVSVGSLWNIWARNLSNMFVAPLSVQEYLFAHMISGAVKAGIIFLIISCIAVFIFNFNIFTIGAVNLILFFINLVFFAWSVGLLVLGLIFRYGTRIQAFAWSIIFLFQPLTANLFPLSILPKPLVILAKFLPPTYIFEAARYALQNPTPRWDLIYMALFQNCIYFCMSVYFFKVLFEKSRETGQFVRNEG
jgi:ABC-2 type transport system permease protein